jgi:hypothetical protein
VFQLLEFNEIVALEKSPTYHRPRCTSCPREMPPPNWTGRLRAYRSEVPGPRQSQIRFPEFEQGERERRANKAAAAGRTPRNLCAGGARRLQSALGRRLVARRRCEVGSSPVTDDVRHGE